MAAGTFLTISQTFLLLWPCSLQLWQTMRVTAKTNVSSLNTVHNYLSWRPSSSGPLSFPMVSHLRIISCCCGCFCCLDKCWKALLTRWVSTTETQAVCCVLCAVSQPTSGPGELRGGPGAALCCCFSSSICCREKKGRRRDGGSSGWRLPHSSKLLAWRHRTWRRRFFLWRVLKWQYSQAKGLAPRGTGSACTHTASRRP